MGKIRVKTFGNEEEEAKEKAEKDRKRAEKKARGKTVESNGDSAQTSDEPKEDVPDNTNDESLNREDLASQGQALEPKEDQTVSPVSEDAQAPQLEVRSQKSEVSRKAKKEKFLKKTNKRSANYNSKVMEVDKNKTYSLPEALELLRKVKLAKFDETVELHINTIEAGISGTVKLPHGTGKEIKVAIATDEVLAEVEKGKINFDVLIATPAMMPKLGKVARVLGPKGLMPNPKNGTISENPEEAMKKFQGGQISFKTESKIPVIHVSVGKTSFDDKDLSENIKTMMQAIRKDRTRNVVLKSTMSPAIKLAV